MKTVQQLCLDAALYLEENGWIQGEYGDIGFGPCCLYGAVVSVAGKEGSKAASRVADFAEGEHLAKWNDEPGRTKEEVIAKLRELAEKAGLDD